MTDNSRVLSGFRAELIAKTVGIISGTTLLILLSRLLGTDDYGRLSLALSVFSFGFLFANFGFPKSGARYITEYVQKDTSKIRFILRITTLYIIVSTVVVCGLLLVFNPIIDQNLSGREIQPLLAVGILYIAAQSFASYPHRMFQALGAPELGSLVKTLIGICNLLFVLVFIYIGWGAIGAVVGYTLSLTLVAGISIVLLYSRFYTQYETDTGFDWELAQKIFEYNFSLAATSGARAIEKEIDILMIGVFLSPTMVGIYSVGKRVTTKLNAPAGALGFSLSPLYSERKLSSGVSEAGQLYREGLTKVLLLYVPAVVGLMLVARPLIQYVFGAEYLPGAMALQILSLLALLRSVGNITASGLDYLGRAKQRAWLKTTTTVANVILNFVLIPTVGVVGAAIATVSSYSVYMFGNVAIMQTELNFVSREFVKDVGLTCFSALLMAIPVYLFRDNISGIFSLFAVISIGIAVWLIIVYMFGLIKKEEMTTLLSLSSRN